MSTSSSYYRDFTSHSTAKTVDFVPGFTNTYYTGASRPSYMRPTLSSRSRSPGSRSLSPTRNWTRDFPDLSSSIRNLRAANNNTPTGKYSLSSSFASSGGSTMSGSRPSSPIRSYSPVRRSYSPIVRRSLSPTRPMSPLSTSSLSSSFYAPCTIHAKYDPILDSPLWGTRSIYLHPELMFDRPFSQLERWRLFVSVNHSHHQLR